MILASMVLSLWPDLHRASSSVPPPVSNPNSPNKILLSQCDMHVIENLDLSGLVKDMHWQWMAVTQTQEHYILQDWAMRPLKDVSHSAGRGWL
ncbi:hypothetical protein O3P69_003740 [Scylla paramamosain]|uniref:Uncharacterized protein n=1 Tax=Scylla paramamosain TaxID=85552 RepID=A0AAW0UH66_SCYPA